MTTKPEGPQSRSMQRKIALQKGEPMPTYVPATAAPSQPAGARELWIAEHRAMAAKTEGHDMTRCLACNGMVDAGQVAFAERFARQQTAAKDAEIERWKGKYQKLWEAKDSVEVEFANLRDAKRAAEHDLASKEAEIAEIRKYANKLLKDHAEALQTWMDRAQKFERERDSLRAELAALKAGKDGQK